MIRRVFNSVAFPIGHGRDILELLPGPKRQEFPTSETPKQVITFISRFMQVKGEFPETNFRMPGWVHSLKITWWAKMASSSSKN